MTNQRYLVSRNKREGKFRGKQYKLRGNKFIKVNRRTCRWEILFRKYPPNITY